MAGPHVKLFYNDYGWGVGPKFDVIYHMLRNFSSRDPPVPIDGVGLQMHCDVGSWNGDSAGFARNLSANIENLTGTFKGLEFRVTEMDVTCGGYSHPCSEALFERQAQVYGDILEACLNNTGCTAFETWGFVRNTQSTQFLSARADLSWKISHCRRTCTLGWARENAPFRSMSITNRNRRILRCSRRCSTTHALAVGDMGRVHRVRNGEVWLILENHAALLLFSLSKDHSPQSPIEPIKAGSASGNDTSGTHPSSGRNIQASMGWVLGSSRNPKRNHRLCCTRPGKWHRPSKAPPQICCSHSGSCLLANPLMGRLHWHCAMRDFLFHIDGTLSGTRASQLCLHNSGLPDRFSWYTNHRLRSGDPRNRSSQQPFSLPQKVFKVTFFAAKLEQVPGVGAV